MKMTKIKKSSKKKVHTPKPKRTPVFQERLIPQDIPQDYDPWGYDPGLSDDVREWYEREGSSSPYGPLGDRSPGGGNLDSIREKYEREGG